MIEPTKNKAAIARANNMKIIVDLRLQGGPPHAAQCGRKLCKHLGRSLGPLRWQLSAKRRKCATVSADDARVLRPSELKAGASVEQDANSEITLQADMPRTCQTRRE